MFARRNEKELKHKFQDAVFPKMGWKRTVLYYQKRLLRISDTSHSIAAGLAFGVAVSFTPLIGLHVILTILLCTLLRGNIIAGLLGTLIGNPSTFPFIWFASYMLGKGILGRNGENAGLDSGLSLSILTEHFTDIFLPMLIGGTFFAVVAWFTTYHISEKLVGKYQEARRTRMAEKRKMFQKLREKITIIKDKKNNKGKKQ